MPYTSSFGSWSQVLTDSFQNMWFGVVSFVPNLLVALIIFVFGWILAGVLARGVSQIIKSLRLDNVLQSMGTADVLERAGFRLNSGSFIGELVRWFVIIVFLVASLEVLGLTQVNQFLKEIVLGYLPNVIIATLILLMAAVIANVLQKLVLASAKAADLPSVHLVAGLTRWSVWIFGFIAALSQLRIAVGVLNILLIGFVSMIALAGGLAFGLGSKEVASDYLKRLLTDVRGGHHER